VELKDKDVLLYGMLASEEQPFDAMEIAIDEAFAQFIKDDKRQNYTMLWLSSLLIMTIRNDIIRYCLKCNSL
jgi:hypothetical protein